MSLNARYQSLQERHQKLDKEIHEEVVHTSPNELVISSLKKKKLQLKEEMERLRDLL
jgi:hypothetical protein